MLALVAVICAGVLPAQWLLRNTLRDTLQARAAGELQAHAALLAGRMRTMPDAESMRTYLRDVALDTTERITFIALDGTVLLDSAHRGAMENHLQRPEVQAALAEGVGVADRVSASDGLHYLYVALPVTGTRGMRAVLRLARPADSTVHLAEEGARIVELGLATSVSLALLLSFLAVLKLVRPLRRMRDAAASLGAGEFTVRIDVNTGDELEELARGLETVGAQLRARLASAGSGEALLGQLVHAMVQGVIVMGPDRTVRHINGVARAQLGLRGPQESERVIKLMDSAVVCQAALDAVKDPLGVDVRVPHPVSGEPTDGTVVALRRPDGEPLIALILDVQSTGALALGEVPDPRDVVTLPLREMMDRALARVAEDLEDSNASFSLPDEWPAATLAEVGGRVEGAVTETLRAAARAPGAQSQTPLTAALHPGFLCLRLPVSLSPDAIRAIEPRLAPLGGRVEVSQGSVQLWLPRA